MIFVNIVGYRCGKDLPHPPVSDPPAPPIAPNRLHMFLAAADGASVFPQGTRREPSLSPFSLIFFPPLSQPTLSSVHTTAKVPLTISGSWQQGNGHGTRGGWGGGDGKASFLSPPWGEPNPRTMNRTEGKERGFLNSPYILFPTLLCGSFTSGALAAAWGRGEPPSATCSLLYNIFGRGEGLPSTKGGNVSSLSPLCVCNTVVLSGGPSYLLFRKGFLRVILHSNKQIFPKTKRKKSILKTLLCFFLVVSGYFSGIEFLLKCSANYCFAQVWETSLAIL